MASLGEDTQNNDWKFCSLNQNLSVRFEKGETIIFIKGKKFDTCKSLCLNIPTDTITLNNNGEYEFKEEYESMDEFTQQYKNKSLTRDFYIEPAEEFKAHISNLQVWVECDYDTRFLDKKLAFPLLKKLTRAGDLLAQEVLHRDIISRFNAENLEVRKYLIEGGYLAELSEKELEDLLEFEKYEMFDESLSKSLSSLEDCTHHIAILRRFIKEKEIGELHHRRAHLVLAYTYFKKRKFRKARRVLQDCLHFYPNDRTAKTFMAQSYWFEGRVSSARSVLREFNIINQKLYDYELFMFCEDKFYSSLVKPVGIPRHPPFDEFFYWDWVDFFLKVEKYREKEKKKITL